MGAKHPLGLWEGATENATVCQGLLISPAAGCAPTGACW